MKNLKSLFKTIAITYLVITTLVLAMRQLATGDAFTTDVLVVALLPNLIVGIGLVAVFFGWLFFVRAPALHWLGLGFATFVVYINIYRQNPSLFATDWGIYPNWDILFFQAFPVWITALTAMLRDPDRLTRKEAHLQQVFNDAVEDTAPVTKWAD